MVCKVVDADFVLEAELLCYHTDIVHSPGMPLVDIAEEEIQETVQQNAQAAIGGQAEIRASSGSWRTAELAWWMFASWREVAGYGHCIGLVEAQMEVVQTTADFVVHSALTPPCLYGAHSVDQ